MRFGITIGVPKNGLAGQAAGPRFWPICPYSGLRIDSWHITRKMRGIKSDMCEQMRTPPKPKSQLEECLEMVWPDLVGGEAIGWGLFLSAIRLGISRNSGVSPT